MSHINIKRNLNKYITYKYNNDNTVEIVSNTDEE